MRPVDRWDIATAAVGAVAAMVAYALTVAPGLLRADSGEFQTLAATLGYAHPTGYPWYLILAHLVAAIPCGELAWRVNLLSSLCAAAVVGQVVLIARAWAVGRATSVAGAVALAASPTFWSQAVIAEVYTPAMAVALAVILCLIRWQRTERSRWLFFAGALGGVVLGLHITHGLMAPAVVVLLIWTPWRRRANWAAAVGGATAGIALLLAAYAVIDRADPSTNYLRTVVYPSRSLWGLGPEDFDSLADRVALSLRAPQYQGLFARQSFSEMARKLAWYLGNLPREFAGLWLAAAAAGVAAALVQRRRWAVFLVLVALAHVAYATVYDMGGVHVLYLPTYAVVALFGALGLDAAGRSLARVASTRGWARLAPRAGFLLGALGLVIALLPLAAPGAWTSEGRRAAALPPEEADAPRGLEYSRRFQADARATVASFEPGAVVFTGWCFLYPYYYAALIELGRDDVRFYQDYPQPDHFELADSVVELVEAEWARRPIYFTHTPRRLVQRYDFAPVRHGSEVFYRVAGRRSGANQPD